MFSRSILVTLLTFAIAAQASPNGNKFRNGGKSSLQTEPAVAPQCSTTNTVVRTVTVTARGAVATTNAAAITTKASATTTAKAAAGTTAAAGNGSGNAGNGNAGNGNVGNGNTGNGNGNGATGNPQTSLTLDPKVIASGFANNGQDVPTEGQVPSLTSTNNFINFCLTVPNLPITNGKQITTGSCNPAPIGVIPSVDNMPSSKFVNPPNFGTIKSGTTFNVEMAIQRMQTGFFVNAQENYFSAPQQLNAQGQIQGHSHVVIEALTSLSQTTPNNPKNFVFFKGLNAAAVGGKLTATVTGGLAPGFYKLSSINSASNHQPVIVPVAQHGSLDDAIYFTVTADGRPLAATGAAAGGKNFVAETPAVAPTSSAVKGAASVKASSSVSSAKATKTSTTAASVKNNGKPSVTASSSKPAATTSAAFKGGRRARRALNRQAQA